ncbi:cytochrome P450 [Stereum hirsutum FP-91666 SS1]|uniref:Cytochrome P450 n=1 Tax=Stereum hirsutum (strain FP-91666) TaxID=721885 RepID=R7S1B7_STEHR|nr:cytochrome P450 [Stereum hirsutum FP-91666 SS1]EIM80362.1 cytochrome P450 [Stereum hirsutum FP-91666 SS1]
MISATQVLLYLPVFCVCWLAVSVTRRWIRQAPLHKIPGPPRLSLINGNLKQIFDINRGMSFHTNIIQTYGRIIRIWGLLGDTQLYISDPKALHNILIKDQYVFEETSGFIVSNRIFFGMNLTGTLGEHHRRQRKLLNPVFSAAHMRYMIPVFYKITHQLCDIIKAKTSDGPRELDIMEWMGRVALELVGQGGLGYSFNALDENVKNAYAEAARGFTPALAKVEFYRPFLPLVVPIVPAWVRRWLAKNLPWKDLNNVTEIVDIMNETSIKILEEKKKALQKGDDAVVHQVAEGRDIMSILLQANISASEDMKLPESEILAQMSLLIFAAMDTTSSALTRILHVLSENQDVQDKLREEVLNAYKSSESGDLDYDTLHELPYLEAVCRETLRLYSPVLIMSRTARKDIMVPLDVPTTIGNSEVSEMFIPEDTTIYIGIRAINTDPLIWGPDANEWKPERFLNPLPESVTDAKVPGVYANLLTFLGGGRACIGFKFSQMEMKIVLSLLISTFKFTPSKKSVSWKLGGVLLPMEEGSLTPSLPLVVSLVKETGKN